MRRVPSRFICLISIVSLPFGCLGPQRDDYMSSRPLDMKARSPQADRLWEAIQETLRRHDFRLDRVDRQAGVITTLPVASQHFFEFWRHDVDTRRDFWEATLNPLRRSVTVRLATTGPDAWTRLSVEVEKERFTSPDRQFNNTGAAYQFFGDSLPSTTGSPQVTAEYDQWVDIGRDPAMEDYFLRHILARANGVPKTR